MWSFFIHFKLKKTLIISLSTSRFPISWWDSTVHFFFSQDTKILSITVRLCWIKGQILPFPVLYNPSSWLYCPWMWPILFPFAGLHSHKTLCSLYSNPSLLLTLDLSQSLCITWKLLTVLISTLLFSRMTMPFSNSLGPPSSLKFLIQMLPPFRSLCNFPSIKVWYLWLLASPLFSLWVLGSTFHILSIMRNYTLFLQTPPLYWSKLKLRVVSGYFREFPRLIHLNYSRVEPGTQFSHVLI